MRRLVAPQSHSVLYPHDVVTRGYTKIYFGENQIFASLISLLLLSTAHPPSLQPRWVRASTDSYIRFTLAMDSSLAFGSIPCYQKRAFNTRFRSGSAPEGLNQATQYNSPAHYPEGTPSHLVRRRPKTTRQMVLRPLVGAWFQILFHLCLTGLLFTFRSRYFCAIGRPGVLSLGGWTLQIQAGFHVSDSTWESINEVPSLSPTGLSPSVVRFSKTIRLEKTFVTSPQACARL